MYSRNTRGERRVSPQVYKRLRTIHIAAAGGWLGVSVAKLALAIGAATTDSAASYSAMEVVNWAFRPATVATLITGVLLSLGTKWGLLQHYWVATKLFLTVLIVATSGGLLDGLIQQSIRAASGRPLESGSIVGDTSWLVTLVVSLTAAHMVMLGIATVVSVYRPWGKIGLGWRKAGHLSTGKP